MGDVVNNDNEAPVGDGIPICLMLALPKSSTHLFRRRDLDPLMNGNIRAVLVGVYDGVHAKDLCVQYFAIQNLFTAMA
jgi:hypothetical protein